MTTDPGPSTPARRPLYEASSQFRSWRFSAKQLHDTRTVLNADAVAAIKSAFETDLLGSSAGVQFLTADEENILVRLYIEKVSHLCGHFRFTEEVEATAISYLKRFYLKNTVMDWHPKNVMLTALFLATKTTNHPIALDTYVSSIPKTATSDVLDLEFLVSQSLNFEFNVWHAHRALWGIYLDLQELHDIVIDETFHDIYHTALKHVRASRLTDAELIYTPSQIAVACFYIASPELAQRWVAFKQADTILDMVKQIADAILKTGVSPDVEAVRAVDKRLRLCKNPEKVPGTKAYLAKKGEEEARAAEKKARKADEAKKARDEESNLFGEELISGADNDVFDDADD